MARFHSFRGHKRIWSHLRYCLWAHQSLFPGGSMSSLLFCVFYTTIQLCCNVLYTIYLPQCGDLGFRKLALCWLIIHVSVTVTSYLCPFLQYFGHASPDKTDMFQWEPPSEGVLSACLVVPPHSTLKPTILFSYKFVSHNFNSPRFISPSAQLLQSSFSSILLRSSTSSVSINLLFLFVIHFN